MKFIQWINQLLLRCDCVPVIFPFCFSCIPLRYFWWKAHNPRFNLENPLATSFKWDWLSYYVSISQWHYVKVANLVSINLLTDNYVFGVLMTSQTILKKISIDNKWIIWWIIFHEFHPYDTRIHDWQSLAISSICKMVSQTNLIWHWIEYSV